MPQTLRRCTHIGEPHPRGACPSKHEWTTCCPHKIWQPRRPNAEYLREWRKSDRRRVLEAYGGACACCGETGTNFLTLDHKNGDGAWHRSTLPHGRQTDMYRWARRNDYPDTLQILCWNCNYARGLYGECH